MSAPRTPRRVESGVGRTPLSDSRGVDDMLSRDERRVGLDAEDEVIVDTANYVTVEIEGMGHQFLPLREKYAKEIAEQDPAASLTEAEQESPEAAPEDNVAPRPTDAPAPGGNP